MDLSKSDVQPVLERFRLEGRVALVTGGGQGIGRAFAHALGEAGAKVAVVDINRDKAEAVTAELEAKGHCAVAVVADVTIPGEVDAMVDQVVDHFGSLEIGVNNAGIGVWHGAEAADYEEWKRVLDLNLNAVYLCARAEARVMLKAGYGKIINTASMSAHIVNRPQNQSAYNSSKAGVIHLTRSLAAEWAPRGVRVNSISPGYTRTQLVEDLLSTPDGAGLERTWTDLIPMGRMGTPVDLQGALIYLASAASDYMTGHDLLIDGGYCLW